MHKNCTRAPCCCLQLRAGARWKGTTGVTGMNSALIQVPGGSLPSTGKPRSSITNNLIPNNITNVTLNLEAKHQGPENQHLARLRFTVLGFSSRPTDHHPFPPAPRYAESLKKGKDPTLARSSGLNQRERRLREENQFTRL